MDRKLIEYLPDIIRDYGEFQAITASEQMEFEKVWSATDDLLDNQFINTAGNIGLARWERILGLVPKGTDTLEDRRFCVLSRLNEQTPFTIRQLCSTLEGLCGSGNYTVSMTTGTYILVVRVGLSARSNFDAVQSLLQRIVPANIVIDLSLLYNTHSNFSGKSHKELKQYTHYELRNKVMDNA